MMEFRLLLFNKGQQSNHRNFFSLKFQLLLMPEPNIASQVVHFILTSITSLINSVLRARSTLRDIENLVMKFFKSIFTTLNGYFSHLWGTGISHIHITIYVTLPQQEQFSNMLIFKLRSKILITFKNV